ncbi:insulinase family protein [Chlamydiales bacterium]|nr:insulinase family protein [Chlamydiales bacterium]
MKTNGKIGTFIIKKEVELPEINALLTEYEEEGCGAQVMHIQTDDPENLFNLSFKTIPENSNGVAHILEHTVLCGSDKFPIRDPFFLMFRRSLNTFMNALTGQDFTCYPAASQNKKDLYNLMDVYIDAVFSPRLDKLNFLQEGHRLEFSEQDDPASRLTYKGIVFNEMKGAFSSPTTRLSNAISKNLFPETSYQHVSGGDPKVIPELTYEQFIQFHKTYYHPSRCLFYFYGNMPIKEHLEYLYERILKGQERLPPIPPIPFAKRHAKPVTETQSYPIAQEENEKEKTLLSISWLTCPASDPLEALAIQTILSMLLETDASPLRKALLKSNLCKEISVDYDSELVEVPVGIDFYGCQKENTEALVELLDSLLIEFANRPFDKEMVESALHQIEFSRSEIGGSRYPYGLILYFRAGLIKQQGGSPEEALKIHSIFNSLREKFQNDPTYFNKIIKKWFVENPHKIITKLIPDKELESKEQKQEEEKLAEIKKSLTKEEIENIIEQAKELELSQKEVSDEEKECLPKITLDEIPNDVPDYPLTIKEHEHITSYHHNCFTNHITYASLAFELPHIEESEIPILRLFNLVITEMGTDNKSYEEMLNWMQATTGGLACSIGINQSANDYKKCKPTIHLTGKALERNTQNLFSIMNAYLKGANFSDQNRLKEIVNKHYIGLQSSITSNAINYCRSLAKQGDSIPNYLMNKMWGLDWYWQVKEWMETIDQSLPMLISRLNALKEKLFSSKPDLILSCSKEQYKTLEEANFYELGIHFKKMGQVWQGNYPLKKVPSQARIIAAPISYCTKSLSTSIPFNHQDIAPLTLASYLFDNKFLHREIREKGGAYGGGSSLSSMGGSFDFYSYRDPQIAGTLKVFESTPKHLVSDPLTNNDLDEAKLEFIQDMDTPIDPGARAIKAYGWNREEKTKEMRQAYRNQVLHLTVDQIKDAVKRKLDNRKNPGCIVIMAGKELIEKENLLLKNPLPIFSTENDEALV